MSHFYYQVLRKIQSHLQPLQLFFLQMLQILLYLWTLLLVSLFYSFSTKYSSATISYIVYLLLIFLIARSLTVYIKHRIHLLTPTIKHAFLEEDQQLLIIEIEEALQKSLEFTKWSCGILSTVLALVLTMFFNIGLKILDRTISDDTLTKKT